MAWKNTKKSKRSVKHDYLDSALMNKASDCFNGHIFKLVRGLYDSIESAKHEFIADWAKIKVELEEKSSEKVILSADQKILSINNLNEQDLFVKGNEILDGFRRQSDVALCKAKNDLMFFWLNAAYKNTKDWDVTWLRRISESEKFMPFYEGQDRYIFNGYVNQMVLAHSIEYYRLAQSRPQAQNVVLFMGDIQKILTEDFIPDKATFENESDQKKAIVTNLMKGKKSLTSVFVRTSQAQYKNADGSFWKSGEDKKYPSKEDLASGLVQKKEIVSYISNPVWLVDSLLDILTEKAKQKYADILTVRVEEKNKVVVYEVPDAELDLDLLIDHAIRCHIQSMAIEVVEGGDRACYFPSLDKINIPVKTDFANPVVRYATTVHEIAHSTKHLAGRKFSSTFGTIPYAIEEIIAESVSMLSVQDLKERLTEASGGKLPDQWSKFFEEYYENSKAYNLHWGSKFDFPAMLDQLFDANEKLKNKKTDVFNNLIENTLSAYKIVKTGLYNNKEITPEIRISKKIENEKSSDMNFSPLV
jgi:hypothetical protein